MSASVNDTPAARTLTRTSPGPGRGTSSSTTLKTSGPPKWSTTTRCIRSDCCPVCSETACFGDAIAVAMTVPLLPAPLWFEFSGYGGASGAERASLPCSVGPEAAQHPITPDSFCPYPNGWSMATPRHREVAGPATCACLAEAPPETGPVVTRPSSATRFRSRPLSSPVVAAVERRPPLSLRGGSRITPPVGGDGGAHYLQLRQTRRR